MLLGMAFYVSRRASVRIAGLLKWSQRIAGGDLSNHLFSDAGDEVGQLTNAMHDMVQNLARGRSELEKSRKDAEAVAEELRQYANAFRSSGEAMLISDRFNRIVDVNATFSRANRLRPRRSRGQDPQMLASGKTPKAVYDDMWRSLQEHSYWHGELWDRKSQARCIPPDLHFRHPRCGPEGHVHIASFADISERKASEARIDYLAHHDALTGLINRYNLENRLDQALLSAHRDNLRVAVMFIDMDRFKTINDSLGHYVGDQLLIRSRSAAASAFGSDIVARLRRRIHRRAHPHHGRMDAARSPTRSCVRLSALRLRRRNATQPQHRHRGLPQRRRGRPDPDEECRHRHVPRQGSRPEQCPVLHPGDECRRQRAAGTGKRLAPGHAQR
jgi:GGDEF domain-containing protein/HAMP domain-containing protein